MFLLFLLNIPLLIFLELESNLPLWVWLIIAAIVILYVSSKIGEATDKKIPLHSALFKLPDLDRAGCLTYLLVFSTMLSVGIALWWLYHYLHDTLSIPIIVLILSAILLTSIIGIVAFFIRNRRYHSASRSLRFSLEDVLFEIIIPIGRYIGICLIYVLVVLVISGALKGVYEMLKDVFQDAKSFLFN